MIRPKNFENMIESFAQLSICCPRLNTYQELFKESTRLQTSLSDFFALIVKFCTKAMEIISEKGTSY